MTSFTGIWVPLVTPFAGGIDFAALRALAQRLHAEGASGLVVCGSTGEAAALDEDEQLAVLDAVLDAVPDCAVVMGLSGARLPDVLAQLGRIQQRPVAGVLVPPPYYVRPAQSGIVDWFSALADAAHVPLILYNIPYRTGVNITLDTFRTLAKHPRIVAVKDCGGDAQLTMSLLAETPLQVLSGEDHQLLSTLALGGSGAIMASAHLHTAEFVRVAALMRAGALEEARALFYRLLPLVRLLFEEPNPAPLKAALAATGAMREELRPPLRCISASLRERLLWQLRSSRPCFRHTALESPAHPPT